MHLFFSKMLPAQKSRVVAGLLLAAWPLLAGAPAHAQGLKLPFAIPAPQSASAAVSCPAAPPAVTTLATQQPYKTGDASYSVMDPVKQQLREAQLVPVKLFTYRLTRLANAYEASQGRDKVAGACALKLLADWAGQGAMQNMDGHDPQFLRILDITSWATDFAQVSGLDLGPDDRRPQIRAWLLSMAQDMRRHFDGLPSDSNVRFNNHRYWAGFAAIAVAVVANDRALADWGVEAARVGLAQVTPQGALPRELERKSRARQYTIYSAQPLTLTAEYAAANGIDLYSANGGALHRLVGLALQSAYDPSVITALAGVPQEPYVDSRGAFYKFGLAWFEYYNRRFPGKVPEAGQFLAGRPYINDELGGDITRLVGAGR